MVQTIDYEREEQIAALLIMTRFSEAFLRGLDSHELTKLYEERATGR